MDVQTAKQIEQLLKNYKSGATPSNHSEPIEYSDIKNLVDETAKLIANVIKVMDK